MPPPSPATTSKFVLRSLYRSLLRAAAPFSHPNPSAAAHASLIHRSGIAHDWEECVHKLDSVRQRRRVAAASASRSASSKNNNEEKKQKENNLPRSWAQNLSRSYSDLREEYALRKDYFEQRYGDVDDHGDWDDDIDDDETAMDLAVGSSSYYKHNEDYIMEEDPKFVLFRHLLREWFADSGSDGAGDNNTEGGETKSTGLQWPRQWSPKSGGYYENGRIKQVPLMKFPSQIVSDDAGLSLRALIQREFRAPTVEERLRIMESKPKEDEGASTTAPEASNAGRPRPAPRPTPPKAIYPSSSYIDNVIRIQTAFYTLTELNRKLAWAENMGFPPVASPSQEAHERKYKRLVQAAKGVSHLSSHFPPTIETKKAISKEELLPLENEEGKDDSKEADDDDDDDDSNKTSSSSLQCGTYLIAHPLMTGYFAKSVIVLLDHAEEEPNSDCKSKTEEGNGGGTYGLIINRLALQPPGMVGEPSSQRQQWEILRQNWEEEKKKSQMKEEEQEKPVVGVSGNYAFESLSESPQKTDSSEEPRMSDTTTSSSSSSRDTVAQSTILRRPISLLQAINAEDLPDAVQMAFGDAPVREGGPVNLSLQMIHRETLETKNKESDAEKHSDSSSDVNAEGGEEKEEETREELLMSKIGGTPLLGPEQQQHRDDNKQPKDSEETIYFRGDVMEASYAVLDGKSDRDDFGFIIGAACWAPGQLVNEIERGCWLPFRGPPQMTMTGMVDHHVVSVPFPSDSDDCTEIGGSTLSQFPSRLASNAAVSSIAGSAAEATSSQQQSNPPTMRPVRDLWLSIMCSLGEGEADLAYMMLDNKNVTDQFGDACDNFDR